MIIGLINKWILYIKKKKKKLKTVNTKKFY